MYALSKSTKLHWDGNCNDRMHCHYSYPKEKQNFRTNDQFMAWQQSELRYYELLGLGWSFEVQTDWGVWCRSFKVIRFHRHHVCCGSSMLWIKGPSFLSFSAHADTAMITSLGGVSWKYETRVMLRPCSPQHKCYITTSQHMYSFSSHCFASSISTCHHLIISKSSCNQALRHRCDKLLMHHKTSLLCN